MVFICLTAPPIHGEHTSTLGGGKLILLPVKWFGMFVLWECPYQLKTP